MTIETPSYRRRLQSRKEKANRLQQPPDWTAIMDVGAQADSEIALLRAAIAERDQIITKVRAADERFGHFAKGHRPNAEASPSVLLYELAHLIHEAVAAAQPTPQPKV